MLAEQPFPAFTVRLLCKWRKHPTEMLVVLSDTLKSDHEHKVGTGVMELG